MRLKPAVPFPNNQSSRVFLSHQRTPFEPLLRAHLIALVLVGGSIRERLTQKAIRPAAAPMNTFAAYCDRDDLNVCKRARENGDGTNWT
jgi:hypothetical protein